MTITSNISCLLWFYFILILTEVLRTQPSATGFPISKKETTAKSVEYVKLQVYATRGCYLIIKSVRYQKKCVSLSRNKDPALTDVSFPSSIFGIDNLENHDS